MAAGKFSYLWECHVGTISTYTEVIWEMSVNMEGQAWAALIRAPEAVRTAVPVFQPQAAPVAALAKRLKDGFDPNRILNPGRMYADA